jgi:hypothetical protein
MATASGAASRSRQPADPAVVDWLIDPSPFKAKWALLEGGKSAELGNGLVRRVFSIQPGCATVAVDNLMTGQSVLRSVRPEALVEINGQAVRLGGLTGQPVHNFLKPQWLASMRPDPNAWPCRGFKTEATEARFAWQPNKLWLSTVPAPWPPPGAGVTFEYGGPAASPLAGVVVAVHYELYDGLPLMAKWLTVHNASDKSVTLNSMVVEQLAVVEAESLVDGTPANFRREIQTLEAFSDFAFGGNMSGNADAPAIRWRADPLYATQVHYERQTPCLLEASPRLGPEVEISPGETFESFRVFELIHDSTDRERRGLAVRRAYRSLAPWVLENPILMHVRSAKPEAVRLAIDQCAEVGFEMVIMTFGSGFDIENEDPATLSQIKDLADYARSKGVSLGGYSLLASRSISPADDVIDPSTGKPGGARFGNSPCIGSRWGQDYFRKLRQFFEKTGCTVLEHDGSYPGDACGSTTHPGHRGLKDSQWTQWQTISGFYQWCRSQGIYLNVPDWYYLAGSSKCGMGYRETNWSLPRDQQEIIERQNIFDGTWEKTPSMGWMFVPLTEYHGGGAAATIEPLKDHLEHYETRLANLFGAGVQACYRGPRLYDSPETQAVVKRWVDFYRKHRAILDSDIIHLRRPDGRDWDGWMHVNPSLKERGLAIFYNPLETPVARVIRLPLYYTGLTDSATLKDEDGRAQRVRLGRDASAAVTVRIPGRGRTWLIAYGP